MTAINEPNYDEALVPDYILPDPLMCADGTPVGTPEDWFNRRRPELLALFEREMFGKMPPRLEGMWFEQTSYCPDALGGFAVRKEVRIHFTPGSAGPCLNLLLYLPAAAKSPVPVFLSLNYKGNQAIDLDPGIAISDAWVLPGTPGIVDNHPTEASRGMTANRYPVAMVLGRGYGLATACYGDLDPDYDDGFQNGIHPLFYQPGQTRPAPDEWGAIGAWAWGLSRAMDYLLSDPAVDPARVAVHGHSRLGKTALWAGACDPRFALVISNNSGCCGAALSRRCYGETVGLIAARFPQWFCTNFQKYAGNEAALPFDQHELIALIAPRPVYIASAVEDRWADPRGEFLGGVHASPVYRLLGVEGLEASEMPALNQPVFSRIGYHIRAGKHDVTAFDWQCYLDFADRWMKGKQPAANIRRLQGANLDIDLATAPGAISWEQTPCPWNEAEHTLAHRCAVKNTSICPYFCGVEYLDTLLCCYPDPNPKAS
ncbi:MAG TPA: hypothetical protein VIO61_00595 [Anaerolineaceae bacterium]